MSGVKHFINKNLVLIVMVPGLIGAHWLWSYMQTFESLVSKEQRKGLPIFIGYEKLKQKITGEPKES